MGVEHPFDHEPREEEMFKTVAERPAAICREALEAVKEVKHGKANYGKAN